MSQKETGFWAKRRSGFESKRDQKEIHLETKTWDSETQSELINEFRYLYMRLIDELRYRSIRDSICNSDISIWDSDGGLIELQIKLINEFRYLYMRLVMTSDWDSCRVQISLYETRKSSQSETQRLSQSETQSIDISAQMEVWFATQISLYEVEKSCRLSLSSELRWRSLRVSYRDIWSMQRSAKPVWFATQMDR